jgi:predicted nucleotidyltransferase
LSNPERWTRYRPLPQDIEKRLENLVPLFEKEGVLLAYLFGSLVQKGEKLSRPRPPGDVDLAILTKEGTVYELQEAIVDVLGTDRLDLVDLRKASPVLRFEILRSGRPIYISDDDLRERYEMETIHLYRDTELMRRRQRKVLKERMEAVCSKER